jgi:hypothetical protein
VLRHLRLVKIYLFIFQKSFFSKVGLSHVPVLSVCDNGSKATCVLAHVFFCQCLSLRTGAVLRCDCVFCNLIGKCIFGIDNFFFGNFTKASPLCWGICDSIFCKKLLFFKNLLKRITCAYNSVCVSTKGLYIYFLSLYNKLFLYIIFF